MPQLNILPVKVLKPNNVIMKLIIPKLRTTPRAVENLALLVPKTRKLMIMK